MFKNFKNYIYHSLTILFSYVFKKRTFGSLEESIKKKEISKIPEKELLILDLFVDRSSTIIDVGANNGLYCYYFEEIIKVKNVFAFEPLPNLFKKLKKWFPNISIYQYAISNVKETTNIRIPYIGHVKYETRAKLDDLQEFNETKVKLLKIETTTLDTLFFNKNNSIDFIKIDIEGHESNAILGAKKLIEKDQPVLLVEIELRHHDNSIQPVIELIQNFDYQICFYDYYLNKLIDINHFQNEKNQNIQKACTYEYINNFICFHKSKFEIDSLNQLLTNR